MSELSLFKTYFNEYTRWKRNQTKRYAALQHTKQMCVDIMATSIMYRYWW